MNHGSDLPPSWLSKNMNIYLWGTSLWRIVRTAEDIVIIDFTKECGSLGYGYQSQEFFQACKKVSSCQYKFLFLFGSCLKISLCVCKTTAGLQYSLLVHVRGGWGGMLCDHPLWGKFFSKASCSLARSYQDISVHHFCKTLEKGWMKIAKEEHIVIFQTL